MFKNRLLWIGVIFLLVVAGICFALQRVGYGLTYQVSISMPEGWYFIKPIKKIHQGEVVVFKPSLATQQFLIGHHWLPDDGVMMKHVFAVPGEFVCKRAGYLWIEHKKIAKVFRDYAPGKTLPSTPFCGVLKANEYLLMSTRVPNSFDGRYFGPIKKSAIFGQAVKL